MRRVTRAIYDLLYIEDHAYDLEVVRAVLKDRNHRLRFNSVPSALEAMEFMRRMGKYEDAPLPDLIVLDLEADPTSGFEFLRARLRHPLWKFSRVVVLTDGGDNVNACYDLAASACIQKPSGLDVLASTIIQVETFWFGVATLAPPEATLKGIIGELALRKGR